VFFPEVLDVWLRAGVEPGWIALALRAMHPCRRTLPSTTLPRAETGLSLSALAT